MRSRARLIVGTFALGAGLAIARPVLAQETAPAPPPPDHALAAPPEAYQRARAAWLSECRRRLSLGYGDRFAAGDYCDGYLDYYSQAEPVMMAPSPPTLPRTECREELVYEYVDVPVRARRVIPRRSPPAKRVHPVPGKRLPI